jgi:carbonic anhydrase/acetyltransferase-like protein (isoleucine patch superfamily)
LPILSYKNRRPKISKSSFVAETATLSGDIVLDELTSIWFGASLRAEVASIRIGKMSNVQDNCVVHTDTKYPSIIGERVTIGHAAIIHGARVESNCLIGMGAILLNGVEIGKNCIVAAGSLLTQGMQIPANTLIMGSPATIKRELTQDEANKIGSNAEHYNTFRAQYLKALAKRR